MCVLKLGTFIVFDMELLVSTLFTYKFVCVCVCVCVCGLKVRPFIVFDMELLVFTSIELLIEWCCLLFFLSSYGLVLVLQYE